MAAVYTPEQQARLGVDEFGVQIQEDAQDPSDETTANLSADEQQTSETLLDAVVPGVLPVIIDPQPPEDAEDAEDAEVVEGPCHSVPDTSMVIVQWNPQCDDNDQFLPRQCDRNGDCWCVDDAGERIEANLMENSDEEYPSTETCFAARVAALSAPEPMDLDAGDDTDTGEDDFRPTGDVLAPDHDDSKDYDSQSDNEEQDSDANVPMVGGSQSLGPVW